MKHPAVLLLMLLFGKGSESVPPVRHLVYKTTGDAAAKRVLLLLDSLGSVIAMTSTGKRVDVDWRPRSLQQAAPRSGKGFKLL